jgi:hypothetical protein
LLRKRIHIQIYGDKSTFPKAELEKWTALQRLRITDIMVTQLFVKLLILALS